jgi:hypothetical protein
VGVTATYNFADYDFENSGAFAAGGPWGDIHAARVMAVGSYAIDKRWSVVAGGMAGVAFESGADISSSWTGGVFLAGRYQPSDRLSIQLGVSVASHLEDDPEVLPFVIQWLIDEHWTFSAGALEFGTTDAIGAGAMYRVSDQLSLGARVGFIRQQFRLDDSSGGFAAGGVGQDERGKASLVLQWQPRPGLLVSVLGGVAVAGELKVEDQDGRRLFNQDYDTAPFVAARLAWNF